MTELDLVNDFCFNLLNDFMNHEVSIYRNKLGFHFPFDFKYMLFVRSSNEAQEKLYGSGIRVRYNLFDMFIYSLTGDDYIDMKINLYEKHKEHIKKYIQEFNNPDYNILVNDDDEIELNNDMSKYYQMFVIQHQEKIINIFENQFNVIQTQETN
jgi:hypothetical protein